MAESRYNNFRYDQENYGGVASGVTPTPHTGPYLSLYVNGTNWTSRVNWRDAKFTNRKEIGAAASISIDVTGVTDSAPTCSANFILTFPSQAIYVLVPVGVAETFFRRGGDGERVVVYTYDLIDKVAALDRIPLPSRKYIESTGGHIISTLIADMDNALDTSGVVDGNDVPFLDTKNFSKFSDILKDNAIQSGGYTLQINPLINNGFAVTGDFSTNFGASAFSVDKNSTDWTPQKDNIVPDTNIINLQRVKSSKAGPHHTGMGFLELDAMNSSFKLKSLPYGLEGNELINYQVDGGNLIAAQADIDASDTSPLPNVIPLHYPVQIELADISLGGVGEIGAFLDGDDNVILSALVSGSYIGAKVSGSSYTESIPFAPSGATPDLDHQYFYDWYAFFSSTGLEVLVVENYLNNLAGETELGVILSVNQSAGTVVLNLTGVSDISELPKSIRFYETGDPSSVRGFSNIIDRSGSTITIDNWPEGLIAGDVLSNGDIATTTITEKVIYSGSAPTNRYGAPKLVEMGASGVTARQWTASYGPAIDVVLLDNPYTGVPGRRLRVDTVASRSTDLVISRSGNTAICTIVGERLPLTGVLRLLVNYDVAKIVDVTVQDLDSQARCGIRQGDVIVSDAVLTEDEATTLGQAVLDDFANPKPTGTIIRESWPPVALPLPNQSVSVEEPVEYRLTDADVPIAEVSVSFAGYDPQADEGVLIYQITLGNISNVEAVTRQLLANQTSNGLDFRPLSAPGSRITSGTWDDIDTATIGVTGSVTLNGKPASSTFDPAAYAIGNLREAPVSISGTVTSGGAVGELQIELIYPPLGVDADSETCSYSPRTNLITYRWGRPAGAITYKIQRQVDDGTVTHTLVYRQVDEIFTESYPLPYEPASKAIKILTLGLGLKENADGYITLECSLPQLPKPTTFQIVPGKGVKPSGRIPLLVSAPPTIVGGVNFTNRVEFLRILLTKTPVHDPATVRSDFVNTDVNLVTYNIPYAGVAEAMRHPVFYEEFEPGEECWITAMWVDKFGDEGINTDPFDVLHPPVTAGSIVPTSFFRTPNPAAASLVNQADGGTLADDNETTPQVEHTGIFRLLLGNHNSAVKLWMQESESLPSGGAYSSASFSSHTIDCSDQDVLNGYIDVTMKQRFRWAKKKPREYRPDTVTFIGPNIRQRLNGSGAVQNTHEKRYLVGYTGSAPALVDHVIDAVFDKSIFLFRPGVNGLTNNFSVVANVSVAQKPEALKVRWDRFADDASVRRYFVVVNTANFGTKGPGLDASLAISLNSITTSGDMFVYDPTNTSGILAHVLDAGDRGHHTFLNGDAIGTLTVTKGTTYFVSVIAQLQNGRYSTAFATVVSTSAGGPTAPEDTAVPTLGGAPTLFKVKKNATHIRFPLPSANRVTHTHNLLVIGDTATGPANLVKVLDASTMNSVSTLSSSNDTVGRIDSGTKKTTLELDKATLTALFPGGLIYIWYYAVNNFGTSVISSPILAYTLSTGEASAVGDDTAVPSGLTAPDVKRLKRSALKLDLTAPTSNNLRLRNSEIYISNTAHTLWLTTDLSSSTAVEANGKILGPPSGGVAVPVDRTVLETIFGAGATIHVYAKWNNDFGPSASSGNTSYVLSSGEAGAGQVDLAAPTGLTTPVLSWQAKAFHVGNMVVGGGWNQPYKKYIVISNGGGSYFNLTGYFASTQTIGLAGSELLGRYEIGVKDHVTLGIRLADLRTAFGTGATIFVYFYAENLQNMGTVSSPSSNSNGVVLATAKDIISSRDAVNVVDIGVTMVSNSNILFNGDNFFGDTSGAGAVLNHKRSTLPFSGGSAITSTTSDDVFWVQSDHCLKWRSNASRIYMPLKQRIIPGEVLTLSFMALQTGALSNPVINIGMRDVTSTNVTAVQVPITLTGLTTSYLVYTCTFQRASFSVIANEFLEFFTSASLSGTDFIQLDKFMLVRGKQPAAYSPRTNVYETGFSGSSENPDISASASSIIPPDLGYSSGTQGGGFVKDTGGRLDLFTLL